MTLTEDQVVWGAAAMLLRRHGRRAPDLVAKRITALAADGDEVGAAMWMVIARRLDQMLRSPTTH